MISVSENSYQSGLGIPSSFTSPSLTGHDLCTDVGSHCMKTIVLFTLLIIGTNHSWGQVGSIYANGKKLEFTGVADSFTFVAFDSLLTKEGLDYLNAFGKFYTDSHGTTKTYLIELTPGHTLDEQRVNKDLGTDRLFVVINYLVKNFSINKHDFRLRYSEIREISCDGFLSSEKPNKVKREKTNK